jgi:serine/threonine-protein kinase
MHQILHEDPPLLSEAGGGLVGRVYDDVVLRALAKRPELRFPSAGEMRDALRAAAARAAESTRLTMERTVVQDRAIAPTGEDQAPAGSFDERLLIQHAPHGHARLVDALALYTPDAAEAPATRPPMADAGHAAPSTSHSLPPEIVNAAQHVLARRMGPVAGVLVKRAVDTSGDSRHVFLEHLLAALPVAQQAGLQTELQALLQPPQRTESGR